MRRRTRWPRSDSKSLNETRSKREARWRRVEKSRAVDSLETKHGKLLLQSLDPLLSANAGSASSKSGSGAGVRGLEDQCVFSVVLPESEIVDDILHMADETMKLYEQEKLTPTPIVAPLSHNRLLLNNRIINPDTPCTLYSNGSKVADCTFLSTVVKEKENVEKRKEPEVSATERGDA